jgi:isopentenyl-diphosphate delta-isomerase
LQFRRSVKDSPLILVDENNRAIGSESKNAVHRKGMLHRAFSIFLLDRRGRLLMQRRQADKYHSGSLWSNSCCGHPRWGRKTAAEARRRLGEELGLSAPLTFGFFARYRAALDKDVTENEFVYIYFGKSDAVPNPDPEEVSEIKYVSVAELERLRARAPQLLTYWLREYLTVYSNELKRCWRAAR